MQSAPRPCPWPGCSALVQGGGHCEKHRKAKQHETDSRRLSSTRRGYGYRWQQTSKGFLNAHPLCAECARQGRVAAATVVDHIRPHKGDMVLFWTPSNWQPLCKTCHDSKTAREDGGWGRGG